MALATVRRSQRLNSLGAALRGNLWCIRRYVPAFGTLVVVVVVVENVPDVLNHGRQNIAEVVESKAYVCRYTPLDAAFDGVPQMRERMILIACRRELAGIVTFRS